MYACTMMDETFWRSCSADGKLLSCRVLVALKPIWLITVICVKTEKNATNEPDVFLFQRLFQVEAWQTDGLFMATGKISIYLLLARIKPEGDFSSAKIP